MKISSRALHVLRAIASRKPAEPGAAWYAITVRDHADYDPRRLVKGVNPEARTLIKFAATEDGSFVATADIDIHDEIGEFGVSAKDFISDLKALQVERINLSLHSPGGDYHDGLAIYNALVEHPAKVHVKVMGMAASAASYIAMAGDHVAMPRHTELMIHDASSCALGNAAEMEAMVARLHASSDMIASIYSEAASRRTGLQQRTEYWRDLMKAETWFTAEQAMDSGLIDEVIERDLSAPESEAEELELIEAKAAFKPWANLGVSKDFLASMAEEFGLTVDLDKMTLTEVSEQDTVVNSKVEDPSDEPAILGEAKSLYPEAFERVRVFSGPNAGKEYIVEVPAKDGGNTDDNTKLKASAEALGLLYHEGL